MSGPSSKSPVATRQERLKKALKANMAKRKAQARARDADCEDKSHKNK